MARAVLAILLVASPALAEDDSHQGQLELSVRFSSGLRAIATYDKADYCGKTDSSTSTGFAPVCATRSPFAMDLELGYGVARRIDTFLELRLGLETSFPSAPALHDGPHDVHVSPGARFFFSDAKTSKLFTTAQLVFDGTSYKAGGFDFGVRNMSGLWFDLDRAYGIYAYIGETATFVRWMQFSLEGGIGVQGRYR